MSTFGGDALPGAPAGFYALGLAALIPGYLGYNAREGRGQVDLEYRRYILARIAKLKGRCSRPRDGRPPGDACVDLLRRLDTIQERVDEAGTGLDSFLNAGDLADKDADEIHAYDRRILDLLDELDTLVEGEAWDTEAAAVLDNLDDLVRRRRDSINLIRG